ncbi:hypothetical protein D3C81_2034860 [compost metagenome]
MEIFLIHGAARSLCRSELARDERGDSAFFQAKRVIIHDHREQARSYRGLQDSGVGALGLLQVSAQFP